MSTSGCNEQHTIRLCGTGNIGSKGQIVIPKEIRDILGLESGDSMSFLLKDEKYIGIVSNDQIETLFEYVAAEKNITLIK